MSDDYRKPSRADAPRGKVVRQAEPPSDAHLPASGADPGNRALFAEYRADVRAQLEASRRSADRWMRVLGGLMIAIAIIAIIAYRDEVATTGTILYSARGAAIVGACALLGPWLAAFGNGGAAATRETPLWYRIGAGLAALFGICAMATGAAMPLLIALIELTI